jgi:cell division protein FtsW
LVGWIFVMRLREGTLDDWQKTLKPLAIALAIIAVVVGKIQSDFGSTAVMTAMMVAIAFVAGMPLRRVVMIGGFIDIGVVLLIAPSAYRRNRVMTFLHPESDCQTSGYQVCQALITVGSGGLFGLGVGNSVQAYGYLPEAANDSIFAILAEKFGFVGVSAVIILFAAFFRRLFKIAEQTADDYSRFLVVGILAWLSTQVLINVGAMLGLLPLKGITLPFISYGGTSMLFVMGAIGLVFQLSSYTSYQAVGISSGREGGDYEGSSYRRGERRPHHAATRRRPQA